MELTFISVRNLNYFLRTSNRFLRSLGLVASILFQNGLRGDYLLDSVALSLFCLITDPNITSHQSTLTGTSSLNRAHTKHETLGIALNLQNWLAHLSANYRSLLAVPRGPTNLSPDGYPTL